MDELFPDARFILTHRDEKRWLMSLQNHMTRVGRLVIHYLIYGSYDAVGDADLHLRRYRRHNELVRRHFELRPEKLLQIDLEAGQGWPELCAFLGVAKVPTEPFPHANKTPPMGVR